MRVPIISSILNGLVKAIKALNCKCKSSCCESECTQRPQRKDSSPTSGDIDIHEASSKIGQIKYSAEV